MGAAAAGIQVHHPTAAWGSAETRGRSLARPGTPGVQSTAIVLDEFSDRVVLLVRSWDERVVAWPTRDGQEGRKGCGRECTPCMTVQRLSERAQAQRRGLRRRRGAVPLVAQVQQVDTTPCEEADDDGCQVLLTDGEESDDADAALVVPGKEADVAMLGAGEGVVALPKAFSNADLVAAQAKKGPRLSALHAPSEQAAGAVASAPSRGSTPLLVCRWCVVRAN